MPADTIAPVVREYESEIAKIEVTLAQPRPVTVDKVRLRAALEQRTKERRDALRAEPEVAALDFMKSAGGIGQGNIGEGDILWGADIKPEATADGLVGVPLSRWRN